VTTIDAADGKQAANEEEILSMDALPKLYVHGAAIRCLHTLQLLKGLCKDRSAAALEPT
jgi:hypothetical protein